MRNLVIAMAFVTLSSSAVYAEQPVAPKPDTVAQNLRKVRSGKDPEEVIKAIESFATISDSDESSNNVVKTLLDVLKSSNDIFVRKSIIETLGKIQINVTQDGKAKAAYLQPFVDILLNKDEHSKVRTAVANVFAQTLVAKGKNELPDTEAFKAGPLKLASVKTENEALREACILSVGEFGRGADAEVLSQLLSEPSDRVRAAAATALESLLIKVGSEIQLSVPTVNKLVELLGDAKLDTPLRLSVMRVMAQLVREGNPTARTQAFPLIIKLADFNASQNNEIVLGAVASLGVIGNAEAVTPLAKAYVDYFALADPNNPKDVPVRKSVVKAMQSVLVKQNEERTPDMVAVKGAVSLIADILKADPSAEVKDSAIFTARYLYPKKFATEQEKVVHELCFLLKDTKDESRKKKIIVALESITDVSFGSDYEKWFDFYYKKWPKPNQK